MSTAYNADKIYSLIEKLTEAVDYYLDGYFPEDKFLVIINGQGLMRFVDDEKTIHTLEKSLSEL